MTVSFVTIVPCAYVTGTKNYVFLLGQISTSRAQGTMVTEVQNATIGSILKLKNAAGTLRLLVKNSSVS